MFKYFEYKRICKKCTSHHHIYYIQENMIDILIPIQYIYSKQTMAVLPFILMLIIHLTLLILYNKFKYKELNNKINLTVVFTLYHQYTIKVIIMMFRRCLRPLPEYLKISLNMKKN